MKNPGPGNWHRMPLQRSGGQTCKLKELMTNRQDLLELREDISSAGVRTVGTSFGPFRSQRSFGNNLQHARGTRSTQTPGTLLSVSSLS